MKKNIFLKFLLPIFLIQIGFSSSAQEARYFVSKDKSEYAPETWEAKWISLPGSTHEDKNHVLLARKSFEIDTKTTEARLFITAESHYELWINERFVSRGPARCDSHHQSYDVMDVAPFLSSGKNTIAIRVHFHGIMKSYYSDTYPGLLVQLEIGDEDKSYIASGVDWKVKKDFAWDSRSEWVSSINANNFSSSYDFRKQNQNWRAVNFNDSAWSNGVYQLGHMKFPGVMPGYVPYAVHQPWYSLVPRDLPQLVEYNKDAYKVAMQFESPQFSKLGHWGDKRPYDALYSLVQDVQKPIEKTKIENIENFLKGKGHLKITDSYPTEIFTKEAVYHSTVIFDFDNVIDGYPYIKVKGAKGAIVDVNYTPYLIDGTYAPATIINNFSDRIVLSGNQDNWLGSEIRTLRYMAVTVRSDQAVEFETIGLRVTEYPFKKQETINVDAEPFINDLWTACEKTLQSITTDAFTDNYQERRQYVQTSYYASLGSYGVHGDSWLQRRYLVQHAQNQLPNGIMPMWAPWGVYKASKQVPGIYEASHLWLMALRDYYLYSGDETTVRELLPNAEKLAIAMNEIQVKDNLVHLPPYSYWIDWAKLAQGEQNFIINALQLISFQYYAELLTWLGEPQNAKRWSAEADKMRQSLKRFWSEEKGLFAENMNRGKIDTNFSEHANALAVVSGVATPKQAEIIVQKIINNRDNPEMEESVLFNYWVVEAICRMGYIKEGIDYFKKHYAHMLEEGEEGTLWEYANLYAQNKGQRYTGAKDKFEGRSWCTAQGENGFPGITLSRWVLGFQSVTPGLKEIEINALYSPYKEFSGALPTPQGVITVERKDNKVTVDVPTGVTAYLSKDKLVSKQLKTITIDGKVQTTATLQGDIQIKEGKHSIEF
jgi:alpha-L-rhamnosidase